MSREIMNEYESGHIKSKCDIVWARWLCTEQYAYCITQYFGILSNGKFAKWQVNVNFSLWGKSERMKSRFFPFSIDFHWLAVMYSFEPIFNVLIYLSVQFIIHFLKSTTFQRLLII